MGTGIDIGIARTYITFLAQTQANNARLFGYDKPGPAQFVLDHGKEYPLKFRTLLRRGPLKQCFNNAFRMAKAKKWKYAEGWATNIIPVQHAWCVDDEGNIVETTWAEDGLSYFGVEIPLGIVAAVARSTGCIGVFASWQDWDLVLPHIEGLEKTNR